MEDRLNKYSKNPIKNNKIESIDIQFDITELDLLCNYIISDNFNVKRADIINMRNVFALMNMSNYANDNERLGRIAFINKGIDARLNYDLSKRSMILAHINGGLGVNISDQFKEISNSEVEWINKTFSSILKDSIIYNDVDKGLSLFTKFKATDYANRGEIVKEIEEFVVSMNNKFRKVKAEKREDIMFSLREDNFKSAVQETYRQITSPSNKLLLGVQALNALTGGGLESGRVYTLLGLPGEGKSSTLLDMALEIKKYNKSYKCKDPTKKPCVVLLIMENGTKETIQRTFNMCVGKGMEEYTEQDAINVLRNNGMTLTDDDPIDVIIKFRPNLSEDTSYMYTLSEDLEDDGYEVICFLEDYLKRIRSVEGSFGGDLRMQLGAVVNEMKIFATLKDIPVVTASQLNRTATSSIDEARIKNKADLVRLIGRSNVGESNLILENSDWVGLIAPEYGKDRVKYLGIQMVKSRYYIPGDFYIAYIPYIQNTIKFVEDFYSPVPSHKITLKEEPMLNGMTQQGQGVINTIKEFTEVNDVKLPDNKNNLFVNASFAAFNNPIIPMRTMCTIVKKEICKIV